MLNPGLVPGESISGGGRKPIANAVPHLKSLRYAPSLRPPHGRVEPDHEQGGGGSETPFDCPTSGRWRAAQVVAGSLTSASRKSLAEASSMRLWRTVMNSLR